MFSVMLLKESGGTAINEQIGGIILPSAIPKITLTLLWSRWM